MVASVIQWWIVRISCMIVWLQDNSTPVLPADIQRRSSSDPGGAAGAEAGSSGATPRTSASVDEQVAAARRRRQHKEKDACKLHLKLTYVQVPLLGLGLISRGSVWITSAGENAQSKRAGGGICLKHV